jgi:hypothetical protein
MPDGALVTVPDPPPDGVTVSDLAEGAELKLALTVVAAFSVSWHGAVPLHPPPLHPEKTEPGRAVAARTTVPPKPKPALHWAFPAPQLIPGGLLVTVPLPFTETVRVCDWEKLAETPVAELIETVQGLVPLQAPPHPIKLAP